MILNYIKIAWKVLLRHPFYTFVTLFGISITLTVIVVLSSFVDHLFAPHYPETQRGRSLYLQFATLRDTVRQSQRNGPIAFSFLSEHTRNLPLTEAVTISSFLNTSTAYSQGRKIKLNNKFTDANFWKVLEFDFLEGKPYTEQNITNSDLVAVITDGLKKQYFGTETEAVAGREIEVEGLKFRVIGVVKGSPPTRFFSYADIYFPYTSPKSNYQNGPYSGSYTAIVLARKASDRPAIQSEFQSRIRQIKSPYRQNGQNFNYLKVPFDDYQGTIFEVFIANNSNLRTMLYSAIAFILFMLLGLPAVNLVNVNVSRILERASEIGVRKAFGAPVRTLLWQFIVENIFITLLGGLLALVLSFLVIQWINYEEWIAYADLTINPSVFLVSLLVCLLFGFLSGVLPALRMSKIKIVDALKS